MCSCWNSNVYLAGYLNNQWRYNHALNFLNTLLRAEESLSSIRIHIDKSCFYKHWRLQSDPAFWKVNSNICVWGLGRKYEWTHTSSASDSSVFSFTVPHLKYPHLMHRVQTPVSSQCKRSKTNTYKLRINQICNGARHSHQLQYYVRGDTFSVHNSTPASSTPVKSHVHGKTHATT